MMEAGRPGHGWMNVRQRCARGDHIAIGDPHQPTQPPSAPATQAASLEDALRQLYVLDAIDVDGRITGGCGRSPGMLLPRKLAWARQGATTRLLPPPTSSRDCALLHLHTPCSPPVPPHTPAPT